MVKSMVPHVQYINRCGSSIVLFGTLGELTRFRGRSNIYPTESVCESVCAPVPPDWATGAILLLGALLGNEPHHALQRTTD